VGKTFPPAVLAAAACCGLRALGENYVQEALPKIAALAPGGKFAVPGIEWHFIGPIQSNKTRAIAEGFDWVHTVDRLHVAQRLSGQRPAGRAPLQVLLEVNLDGEDAKGGIPASGLVELGRAVARLPGLALRGLMAIPRPEADPARQRESFARLARHLAHLQAAVAGDPDTAAGALAAARIDTLSMGMSGDFESALLEGATIVRIGSAIFGSRT
jgi:pyridoxal phosphate enzyme (YggS family)